MLLPVMPKMATLTPTGQIGSIIVRRVMVDMRTCQNGLDYTASRPLGRSTIPQFLACLAVIYGAGFGIDPFARLADPSELAVTSTATLADALGPTEPDGMRDLIPIVRVQVPIFRFDRHDTHNVQTQAYRLNIDHAHISHI